MQNGKNKRVAFHTLGCKLNFSESSEIGRQLEEEGYVRVDFGEEADISVIHTCSVTGSADRKTRQAIRKAKHISPEGITVAMGCYAQLKSGDLTALEGVDLVLGTSEKFDLARYLDEYQRSRKTIIQACQIDLEDQFFSARSVGERTRAFLKVQDGCDYSCSYCTIPKARGKSRNPKIEVLLEQTENLISKGILEIVLTGVNIGDFGRSTGEDFSQLVQALDHLEGNHRFRISSIEPNLLTDNLIHYIQTSAHFAPHFHIPLQSGSDDILKKMSRRYLRQVFADKVRQIKDLIPDAAIGADVIVGFPGESKANFDDACKFLEDLPLSYLHVFTYSERPGTPAAEMQGKVHNRIRDERSIQLHQISEEKKNAFYRSQIGKEKFLIPEGKLKSRIKGFTENYIETLVEPDPGGRDQLLKVRLSHLLPDGTMGGQIISS